MTLCDTGPLLALLNTRDAGHARCMTTLPGLSSPLVTTWPCLAEAMHLLGHLGGYQAQDRLWTFIERGVLQLHVNSPSGLQRMHALMAQYRDAPMDLADASLVAAAEALHVQRIFSLDRHFYAYRLPGSQAFEVVPS